MNTLKKISKYQEEYESQYEKEKSEKKQYFKESSEFRNLIDKSHLEAEIIGEIVKTLDMLSPEGIKNVAEAVKKATNGYLILNAKKTSEHYTIELKDYREEKKEVSQ